MTHSENRLSLLQHDQWSFHPTYSHKCEQFRQPHILSVHKESLHLACQNPLWVEHVPSLSSFMQQVQWPFIYQVYPYPQLVPLDSNPQLSQQQSPLLQPYFSSQGKCHIPWWGFSSVYSFLIALRSPIEKISPESALLNTSGLSSYYPSSIWPRFINED